MIDWFVIFIYLLPDSKINKIKIFKCDLTNSFSTDFYQIHLFPIIFNLTNWTGLIRLRCRLVLLRILLYLNIFILILRSSCHAASQTRPRVICICTTALHRYWPKRQPKIVVVHAPISAESGAFWSERKIVKFPKCPPRWRDRLQFPIPVFISISPIICHWCEGIFLVSILPLT